MNQTGKFKWRKVAGATAYQFALMSDPSCSVVEQQSAWITKTSYKLSDPKTYSGVHYWCMRSRDAAGNESGLSEVRMVNLTQ